MQSAHRLRCNANSALAAEASRKSHRLTEPGDKRIAFVREIEFEPLVRKISWRRPTRFARVRKQVLSF
jgi:hypothetical protein